MAMSVEMNLRDSMRSTLPVGSVVTFPELSGIYADESPGAIRSAIAAMLREKYFEQVFPRSKPTGYRVVASDSSSERFVPEGASQITQRQALKMFSNRCSL